MTISKLWLLALALALVACEQDTASAPSTNEHTTFGIFDGTQRNLSDFADISEAQYDRAPVQTENGQASSSESFMAYSYQMALEAPAEQVGGLFEIHQAACEAAGPETCQIMSASLANQRADRVTGRLEVRALPDWLAEFRSGIENDTEEAGGRILSENTSAEDLSSPILDVRARLSAQISLRDRLQNLLENEGASVEELVNVERELARVQGDIESATSRLRYLERRVSMSQLGLQYTSIAVPIRRSTMNPVSAAFNDFVGITAAGLGAVIRTIAGILPWLILIIPAIWLLRVLWRRRQAKKARA
jgi:hypothetical protein